MKDNNTQEDWEKQLRYIADIEGEVGITGVLDIDIAVEFIRDLITKREQAAKLEAYENVLAWTKQVQPDNKDALMAHGNAVDQIKWELEELKKAKCI